MDTFGLIGRRFTSIVNAVRVERRLLCWLGLDRMDSSILVLQLDTLTLQVSVKAGLPRFMEFRSGQDVCCIMHLSARV